MAQQQCECKYHLHKRKTLITGGKSMNFIEKFFFLFALLVCSLHFAFLLIKQPLSMQNFRQVDCFHRFSQRCKSLLSLTLHHTPSSVAFCRHIVFRLPSPFRLQMKFHSFSHLHTRAHRQTHTHTIFKYKYTMCTLSFEYKLNKQILHFCQ